jgi:hypothetical protein
VKIEAWIENRRTNTKDIQNHSVDMPSPSIEKSQISQSTVAIKERPDD